MYSDRLGRWPLLLMVMVFVLLVSPVLAAPTELVFLHRSATREAQWANEIVTRFNESRPDIHVSTLPADSGPGGTWYLEKLSVLRASGIAPDVFYGASDKMGFVLKGWTLDLTPYTNRDKAVLQLNTFFPGVWESFHLGGKVYGVPLAVTPQFLFYNKDMLEKAGLRALPADWDDSFWTWDDLVQYGRKLTRREADGTYSQVALSRAGEVQLPDLTWIFGGDWFAPEAYASGRATKATMVRAENIQAYEALIDYYNNYAAAGPPKGLNPGSVFTEGKAAIEWIGAWRINSFMAADLGWSWALGPMPLVKTRANTRWTDPLFISATSKHPAEAWEFTKFATNSESQALWTEITGMIPARLTAMNTYVNRVTQASGMKSADVMSAVSGALTHSRRALEESIPEAHAQVVQHMDDWFSPMMNGQMAVRQALERIQEILNAVLAGK